MLFLFWRGLLKAMRSLLHLLGNGSDSFSFRWDWVYFISACVLSHFKPVRQNLDESFWISFVFVGNISLLTAKNKSSTNEKQASVALMHRNCNSASVKALILISVTLVSLKLFFFFYIINYFYSAFAKPKVILKS